MKTMTLTENRIERVISILKRHRTTGIYARNEVGFPVDPKDPHAVCWCGVGALEKVLPKEPAASSYPFEEIVKLNDSGQTRKLYRLLRSLIGTKVEVYDA